MATKPALPANVHLVTLNNVGWNTKLLIPASLLTKFAELMSLCSVVETEWLQGSCETLAVTGDVDYVTSVVTKKFVACASKSQAAEFKKFHDATYELTPSEDRTSGTPVVTLDDFLTSLSDQANKEHEVSYARPS